MEAEVGKMPKVFTRCPAGGDRAPSGTTVVAKIAPSGKGLAMLATTADGTGYAACFEEKELRVIGGGSPDWVKFFNQLVDRFTACSCTTTISDGGCSVQVPSVGTFLLQREGSVSGHAVALDNIVSFVRMRTAKDGDKLMRDITARETESKARAEALEVEEEELRRTLAAAEAKDAANRKQLAELEQELQRLEQVAKAAGEDVGKDEQEDEEEAKVARVRNALGARECKEYDKDLLRVVKSSYLQWDEPVTPEHRFLDTIVPMRSDEWSSAVHSGLGGETKQAVHDLLKKLDEWDYDVFALQERMSGSHGHDGLAGQSKGGALFITTYALLIRHGHLQKFNISERTMLNWLSVVEAGYHPNPYHNSMHAADVLHITNYILTAGGLAQTCNLTDEDIFAAIFAASIHDYSHPGINNNFHIKAQTYLAILYNDRSILENVHVSSVFELMKMDKFNIMSLQHFTDDQRRDIRETIIEMVLATDMGLHAKILGTFKRRLAEDHNFTKKDDIRLAMNMALKMADISNCGRPEHLYLKWCNKIADEFYMQGDRERNGGMPCSPFMDRYQPSMAKGQIAFMNYIVIPLFECISEFLPDMHFSVDFTENNRAYWANLGDDA